MTVRINKPALNLREELTKAQGVVRYEQRQFWAGNLVDNGTFDTNLTGWTNTSIGSGTATVSNGQLSLSRIDASNRGSVEQDVYLVKNRTYRLSFEVVSGQAQVRFGNPPTQFFNGEDWNSIGSGTYNTTFTSTDNGYNTFEILAINNGITAVLDNIQVFEVDENNNVIHSVPLGFKPVHVYEDGLLQREGDNHDYTVIDTGFGYQIKPTVAPTGATETCVIAEREL